jgi:TetR/AcrR family transcriptional regulator, transcriptional repressor for nem operon
MAGRPKEYNRAKIIRIAKDLFWQKGYAATSLTDLTEAMAVSKSTFYTAFASKDALFVICLELYAKEFLHLLTQRLGQKQPVMLALAGYFREIASEGETCSLPKGCMLVSSANEIGAHHPELSPIVKQWMTMVRGAFRNALELAQRKGEIPPNGNASQASIYLLSHMCGLRTMVKCGLPQNDLLAMVENIFTNLPSQLKSPG